MPDELTINFPPTPVGVRNTVEDIADLRALDSTELDALTETLVPDVGFYHFDPSSLAADNGASVIKPTDLTSLQAGRWLLATFSLDSISDLSPLVSKDEASADTGAELIGTASGLDLQEFLGRVTVSGYRAAPHTAYSWMLSFPRVDAPGVVQVSQSCEAEFMAKYVADIQAGTSWVDLTGGGSNSYDGTKSVLTGGSAGPYATIAFAVGSSPAGSPSEIIVRASSDPDNPSVQRGFTWANNAANQGKVKIVRIEGHVLFQAVGAEASALTFTSLGGGTPNTYSAPLAPAWATSTAYVVDDLAVANNKVWRVVAIGGGGMSAAAGTGPSGSVAGVNVTDNQVIWQLATQVGAVLWSGRKLDGYSYPLLNQTSAANVDSTDMSWAVVNGALIVRIGNVDIDTIKDDLEIIYSFDGFDSVTLGKTYVFQQGTQCLWVVPPGSSVTMKGVSIFVDERVSERGGLYIDAGDAIDRRWKIFYPANYCINNNNSDSRIDGVDAYGGKFDNLHYTGTAKAVEVNCKSWRAGNILTWGQFISSLNASAIHDTCVIARFGGDYQYAAGPTVADASNLTTTFSYAWNVGLLIGNGQQVTNRFGVYGFNSVTIFCDTCHIFDEEEGSVWAFSAQTNIKLFNTTYETKGGSGTIDTGWVPENLPPA